MFTFHRLVLLATISMLAASSSLSQTFRPPALVRAIASSKPKIERDGSFWIAAQTTAFAPDLGSNYRHAEATLHLANLSKSDVVFPEALRLVVWTPDGKRLDAKAADNAPKAAPILLSAGGIYAFDRFFRISRSKADPKQLELAEYAGGELVQTISAIVPGKYELEFHYDSSDFDIGQINQTVWKGAVSTNRVAFEVIDLVKKTIR
jgi:hypothetical protein